MRKIIHIDMDAFFAQVEARDNPQYRGKPIVIGSGNPQYGVVSTCSYEARKFGIRSAMPNIKAYKLCPKAIFVRQNMEKYRIASKQIFEIFYEVTDVVEGLSLDEAYLDVTNNKLNIDSATEIAKFIKTQILKRTGLTSSAGVSYNKLLAKLGSDFNKPNGITIIPPHRTKQFLEQAKLRDFPGIGKSSIEKMHILGIDTRSDLLKLSLEECVKYFNTSGATIYEFIRGIDNRVVCSSRERKSLGQETTLKKPYTNIFDTKPLLIKFTKATLYQMQKQRLYAKTFSIKIKYGDFSQYSRAITLNYASNIEVDFTKHIYDLLLKFPYQNKEIRLVGISFSGLVEHKDLDKQTTIKQTTLF